MDQLKVLITGAAGGLGSELAMQLAGNGANLLLLDKDSRGLDTLSDKICAANLEEPGLCPLNLANSGAHEFESLVDILQTQYGGLDVFIHCAAAFQGLQPIDQVSSTQWQECMQVNVNTAWLATVTFLPLLKASVKGRVVFIHENMHVSGSAYWGAYGVSKAALYSLGRILEEELQGTGVVVLNHRPGPMRTSLRARAYLAEDPQSIQDPARTASQIISELNASYSN